MRLFAFLFIVIALAPASTLAQEPVPCDGCGDYQEGAAAHKAPTRIETNSEHGEIRFFIDGDLAAVLKGDGLHVRGDSNFGGSLTDYGKTGFDRLAAPEDGAKGDADAP